MRTKPEVKKTKPEVKKAASHAGFFASGKASDDNREGVYFRWYMTETIEEAGEAGSEKDK